MFEKIRYIQNSFSITFPRHSQIRRLANDFEDRLQEYFEGHYGQPQVISVPDELDPEVPRMIFNSRHGFSQIIISQITMTLKVTYSPEWQTDITKGKQYLRDRTSGLFQLHAILGDEPVLFSGLTTRARLSVNNDERTLIKHLQKYITKVLTGNYLHDINVKQTVVVKDKFYSNITFRNYRTWNSTETDRVPRLPRGNTVQRGIEIIGDFNDRYAYNEQTDYFSSNGVAKQIIDQGLDNVKKTAEKIQEGS